VKNTTKEREATAFHEAGHAVAYLENALEFDSVNICATDVRLGELVRPRRLWGYCNRAMACAVAGPIAERMHTGRWGWDYASDDLGYVDAWTRAASRFIPRAWDDLSLAVSETAKMAGNRWGAIDAVARALLAREELTHGDVVEIADAAPRAPRRPLHRNAWRTITVQLMFGFGVQLGRRALEEDAELKAAIDEYTRQVQQMVAADEPRMSGVAAAEPSKDDEEGGP
jgi:hypothetical protein